MRSEFRIPPQIRWNPCIIQVLLDPLRPPGFRLAALPITLLFGASPSILRLVSLLCLVLAII
jgi:hypothetical protein